MGWPSYYEDIEERRQESLLLMRLREVKLGGQNPSSSPQPHVVTPLIIALPPELKVSQTEKREKRARDLLDIHLLCLAAIRERTPLRH
jgi:hypothetical protein